jgi:di/tricarboxylate transporter
MLSTSTGAPNGVKLKKWKPVRPWRAISLLMTRFGAVAMSVSMPLVSAATESGIMALTAGAGSLAVLASLFAITTTLGLFISNTATAVLMAPVALAIAHELRVSPYPFAMIVALAASTAFMTPISSPVNTLVVGPGNYAFGEFVRIGVPLSVLVMIVSVLLVGWLLPL